MGWFGFSVLSILAKIAGLIDESSALSDLYAEYLVTVGRVFVPFFSIHSYTQSPLRTVLMQRGLCFSLEQTGSGASGLHGALRS